VVGPLASLVADEDPGVDQNFEMVRDSRLSQAERVGQFADACLAGQERQLGLGLDGDDGAHPPSMRYALYALTSVYS